MEVFMLAKLMALIGKGKMTWTLVMNLLSAARDIWGGLKTNVDRSKSEKSQQSKK